MRRYKRARNHGAHGGVGWRRALRLARGGRRAPKATSRGNAGRRKLQRALLQPGPGSGGPRGEPLCAREEVWTLRRRAASRRHVEPPH